ncbi:uncharacterized protein LOC123015464 isoform X2 [Tribolium madens]|uniref:uncharacterized protein LOC123015464 isoform X2 n=1 Tax=Tribolium madens TaxID=41895 RepID=UPI001CF739F5|nr:uncharacterized protein LOC123015464 isoform X2 [Tribolium madens]
MEGGESPLEVLSRAATMVQENQNALASTEESSKQSSNKQLPTTKWKRDRRSRLPEYSRKSDPKIAETFGTEPPSPAPETPNQQAANGQDNAPLDMSVRQRGLPPSYSQTINNPGYRSNYRPSVIQNNREDLPPGISMCDPIIDEHFRRSLGNDYLSLFSNNNVSKESIPVKPPPKVPTTTNVIELMDTAGLSVDDHFAKALGDTWVKLNKKEQELKNNTGDNHSIVTI